MIATPSASRRQFLSASLQGAVVAGLAGSFASAEQKPSSSAAAESLAPVKAIATGARRARKLAVGPADRILVAADRAVLMLDPDGRSIGRIELPRPARCLAVTSAGSLLVGLMDHVEVYSSQGERQAIWPSPAPGAVLAGMTVCGEDLFLADAGNRAVWRCGAEGQVLARIAPEQGFLAPAEFFPLIAGGDGSLFVVNPGRHRIESYSSSGKLTGCWGERSRQLAGFSGCCNPVGLARLPDGRFVTAERGQPRVKLYDRDGQFIALLAGPELFPENARASGEELGAGCQSGGLELALDSAGRLLVLDRVTGQIHVLA